MSNKNPDYDSVDDVKKSELGRNKVVDGSVYNIDGNLFRGSQSNSTLEK